MITKRHTLPVVHIMLVKILSITIVLLRVKLSMCGNHV